MLARAKEQFKRFVGLLERQDIYAALLVIAVGAASFGLGRLSKTAQIREPVRVEQFFSANSSGAGESPARGASEVLEQTAGAFVGSKSGNKYHFPWCAGAQRIKEENKVWFATREEAEAAGYTPAGNCKGL